MTVFAQCRQTLTLVSEVVDQGARCSAGNAMSRCSARGKHAMQRQVIVVRNAGANLPVERG